MLALRKAVFYVFAGLYLIICPLMVARMLGYVVNPLTFHLVKTGLIYVSTNPPDAAVYVDGRQAHQNTPTVLRDLAPGEHFIRMELDGYNDWESNVPVAPRKATVLANTLLIPQAWPVKTLAEGPYQNIFMAAPDVLIATNPLLRNITVFHTTQEAIPVPLFSRNSIYSTAALLHLYSMPSSPFVLLETAMDDKHKFLWINVKDTPPLVEDISELFPQAPARAAWSKEDPNNIFAFYQDNVFRINIKDKAIYPQSPKKLSLNLERASVQRPQAEFLINANNDLLIREGRWIRLLPREDYNSNAPACDIAKSRPGSNMYFEDRNGRLFYLDEAGRLDFVQVLPNKPVLNIPIPDALRIKK